MDFHISNESSVCLVFAVWSPGIVPGDEYRPYLQVNFGNYTQVTAIAIEKPMTSYRTIERFTLQRSIDTVTFLYHESVRIDRSRYIDGTSMFSDEKKQTSGSEVAVERIVANRRKLTRML